MITLYFVKMWFRWLLGAVGLVIAERAVLGMTIWFILAGLGTIAVFTGLTCLMYGDWRSARRFGSGYRYDIIKDVTRR
jgi:hypothetical protein